MFDLKAQYQQVEFEHGILELRRYPLLHLVHAGRLLAAI
jgi:hypothetical protein